jgi:hypothetical protein
VIARPLLLALLLAASSDLRTTVIVHEGRVELAAPGGNIELGPGEAGSVGLDGRPRFLGDRPSPPGAGGALTWVVPLEGTVWVEEPSSGEKAELRPGTLGRLESGRGVGFEPLTAESIRRFLPAFQATLGRAARVGRIRILLAPDVARGIGIVSDETRTLLALGSTGFEEPIIHIILEVDSAPGLSPVSGFTRVAEARRKGDERKIALLFERLAMHSAKLQFEPVTRQTLPGTRLNRRPYPALFSTFLRNTGLEKEERAAIQITHFISDIEFRDPDKASVAVVGSASFPMPLASLDLVTMSGNFRFDVIRSKGEWKLGNGRVIALVVDSPLLSLSDLGIVTP